MSNTIKKSVKDFWNEASCGEDMYLKGFTKEDYTYQSEIRYQLEPQLEFGEFSRFNNKKTLEIGVGLGSDHQQLAKAGALLSGIDLTERAINHTKRRFELFGLHSDLQTADAENIPFPDEHFDAIYTWGVIHHSPNTQKVADEIYRILKPGGFAKIMIYNKYSIIGYMLWLRYGLLALKPWRNLDYIYHHYLESPGTKAYTYKGARDLLSKFEIKSIETPLGHADLLSSDVGQRHRGLILSFARKLWPRKLIKILLPNHGLAMMINCKKPN
jgi:ubiquinone/menaquinone biosynthesis C-methylase UbiE